MVKRRLVTFDWALKKLLRSKANFSILEGFLSELLGQSLRIQEILESEGNQETKLHKLNRLDVKVKNRQGEFILIEVQYEREYDYLQRILFSTAKAVTEHLDEGQPYADIIKVISVNILYFDLGQGQDYVYHGKTIFKGMNHRDELHLSEKQQHLYKKKFPHELFPEFYLIKVNNFDNVARTPLDEWIYFLKNEEIKDSFKAQGLQAAKERLDILKLPERERQAYERYSDDLHYQASMVHSSYGSGKLDGREEGRAEGLAEGRAEGRRESRREIARQLIALGLGLEQIESATGLAAEEIRELQKNRVTERSSSFSAPPRPRRRGSRQS
jgi:predicted transposase/invertase (TIGR01784 family)